MAKKYVDTFEVLGVTLRAEEEVAQDFGFQIQGMGITVGLENMKEDIANGCVRVADALEALASLKDDFVRGAKEGYFEKASCDAINAEIDKLVATIA